MSYPWRSIVLTGASGGIGAALAAELAGPGVGLLLTGRDPGRLEAAAAAARARGAMVTVAAVDVTDAAGMARVLGDFDAARPVDLVIANAGMTAGSGPDGAPEDAATTRTLVEVNLMGAVHTVAPLVPAMAARGRGQIALVASAAALRPHAALIGYSAAKAGLRAYGIGLRGALRPRGVAVCVICPGFVETPMAARHHGAKPFPVAAPRAARLIARALARRRSMVTFPWPLAVLIFLGNRLPPGLSDWLARGFRAWIEPEAPRGG